MPGNDKLYINEFNRRLEEATVRFFEDWKLRHNCEPTEFPLTNSILDWLDHFNDWLDAQEFELEAEIIILKPKEK